MADVLDLETAIIKARGAAAALMVAHNALTEDEPDNWKKLGIERWCGLRMLLLMPFEHDALEHAVAAVHEAVAGIDAAFNSMQGVRP